MKKLETILFQTNNTYILNIKDSKSTIKATLGSIIFDQKLEWCSGTSQVVLKCSVSGAVSLAILVL